MRVALVGTEFYGYIHCLATALAAQGHAVSTLAYPNLRFGWRSLPARLGLKALERRYVRRVLRTAERQAAQADWIILFRGDLFGPEDIRLLRAGTRARLAFWLIDTLSSMRQGRELVDLADHVFCYSHDDAEALTAQGRSASFTPLAYDPAVYYPLNALAQDIDLYFVGNFHRERKEFLERLLERLAGRGRRFVLDGLLYASWRPDLRRKVRREFPLLFHSASNRAPSHALINQMSNRARICLNILPAQAVAALNIRAYEICGAGGFQLVSQNGVLNDLFEPSGEVAAFKGLDDCVQRIEEYLDPANAGRRKAVAGRGHARAMADHTWERRVRQTLPFLN